MLSSSCRASGPNGPKICVAFENVHRKDILGREDNTCIQVLEIKVQRVLHHTPLSVLTQSSAVV